MMTANVFAAGGAPLIARRGERSAPSQVLAFGNDPCGANAVEVTVSSLVTADAPVAAAVAVADAGIAEAAEAGASTASMTDGAGFGGGGTCDASEREQCV